jgi:hypothetical protein
MFAVLHSDINSHKSGFIHLTGQPYYKKCRSAKVKDGIKNLYLTNNLIDRYISLDIWHILNNFFLTKSGNAPETFRSFIYCLSLKLYQSIQNTSVKNFLRNQVNQNETISENYKMLKLLKSKRIN